MTLLRKIDSIKLLLMKVISFKAVILESDREADVCFISYVRLFLFLLYSSVGCYYMGSGGGGIVK